MNLFTMMVGMIIIFRDLMDHLLKDNTLKSRATYHVEVANRERINDIFHFCLIGYEAFLELTSH